MPLPQSPDSGVNGAWPPTNMERAYQHYEVMDAWYTGDIDALEAKYASTNTQTSTGIWGQVRRRFFGTPTPNNTSQRPVKLHVPIAAEIARMSAALLFSELPDIRFVDDEQDTAPVSADTAPKVDPYAKQNAALGDILDDDFHAKLLEGAELASAHGDAYLRIAWDTKLAKHPFIDAVSADSAVPEFSWGRLTAVTFWTRLSPIGKLQYVLLERHDVGTIEYGLYESETKGELGGRVPLTSHGEAAHLADIVNSQSQIETGSKLLTAAHIPNIRPNRAGRKDPTGRNLGRADVDGCEDLMDELDEIETSWQRDFRLGKTRIMVPKGLLQTNAPGLGATFNADQEVFVELGEQVGSLNPDTNTGSAQSFITTFQPQIRTADHLSAAEHIQARIYQSAGYSNQTFGDSDTTAMTATESVAREKLSELTRGTKILYVRPRLVPFIAALVDVDAHVFNGPGRDEDDLPRIEWPDTASDSPKIVADTLSSLNTSESSSIKTRVKILHPDWDDLQVNEEVAQIREDYSLMPMPSEKDLWAAAAANGSNTGGITPPSSTDPFASAPPPGDKPGVAPTPSGGPVNGTAKPAAGKPAGK